jgi:type IV pilus assembly protein PilV
MQLIARNDSRSAARARAGGFTLIEVLVALVITAIGLLGIAKIQALVYANTGSASVRSLVAIQAAGLAAAMHANRAYWAAGSAPYPGVAGFTITGSTTGMTISDNTLNTTATGLTDCNLTGSTVALPCTPAVLAAYDLHTWARGLFALLPGANPVTSIACNPGLIPLNCIVTITWNEKTVSLNAQAAAGATAATFAPTYTLYVEP